MVQNATLGFVFPGQGSQKVGMLNDLGEHHPIVKKTFVEASDVLGYDLWDLIQHDKDGVLGNTAITQPAILTSSVAIWRLWQSLGGSQPSLLAGHSLGEYSALVCSGVIDFQSAVGLVQKRGEYMQEAVPAGEGGMAAIVGLADDLVCQACDKAAHTEIVEPVNYNSPGQVVIAGHSNAVDRAISLCKEAGAKRALPLPVSAPFHSSLMKPAAINFANDLEKLEFSPPQIPVLQNYGLQTTNDTKLIQANLLKQIYSPVPWVKTITYFAEQGINSIYELGPGKVLSGLNRRIERGIGTRSINDQLSLTDALAE